MELQQPFIKSAKFGDLDYSNEDLRTVDLTIRYDWASCTFPNTHPDEGLRGVTYFEAGDKPSEAPNYSSDGIGTPIPNNPDFGSYIEVKWLFGPTTQPLKDNIASLFLIQTRVEKVFGIGPSRLQSHHSRSQQTNINL